LKGANLVLRPVLTLSLIANCHEVSIFAPPCDAQALGRTHSNRVKQAWNENFKMVSHKKTFSIKVAFSGILSHHGELTSL
jgi:hypothetical protein